MTSALQPTQERMGESHGQEVKENSHQWQTIAAFDPEGRASSINFEVIRYACKRRKVSRRIKRKLVSSPIATLARHVLWLLPGNSSYCEDGRRCKSALHSSDSLMNQSPMEFQQASAWGARRS